MTTAQDICTRCVMDRTDPEISFDEGSICNHCREYERRMLGILRLRETDPVEAVLNRIRSSGRSKEYDCVIGVSGGVDSSYLACLTHDWGLRPLAVHLDNGWDSELAVQNIRTILQALDIDLLTHVVEWDEFRDIQRAFFKASVIDIELPTDNAIVALMYRTARRRGIRYVLKGNNDTTEAIMPKTWNHTKTDARNIRAIQKRHGTVPIRDLPLISTLTTLRYQRLNHLTPINILDRINYDRSEALSRLSQLGWRPYPHKHGESIFTRFYQSQVLPEKFQVDKRRAHFSALINAGELSRDEALRRLEEPTVDAETFRRDRQYALKKLGASSQEFLQWMSERPQPHSSFPSESRWMGPLLRLNRHLRGADAV